jgi:hypothetical protein
MTKTTHTTRQLSPQDLLQLNTNEDFEGIYICYNCTKNKHHVSFSGSVIQDAQKLLSGGGNQAVYNDYLNGDNMQITLRPLEGSGLYSLVRMAQHYIDRYGANQDDYAPTQNVELEYEK